MMIQVILTAHKKEQGGKVGPEIVNVRPVPQKWVGGTQQERRTVLEMIEPKLADTRVVLDGPVLVELDVRMAH